MTETVESKRSSLELYHLKHTLKLLDKKGAATNSTSLITLYIPPGTQMSEITSLLRNEYGTASNIKDKKTGKAVMDAISSILARLPNYKIGENGLVIFAGITDDKNKVEFFAIDPPEKVSIKTYRCETRFDTDHLKAMLSDKDQYGIIAIDRGGATFAVIRGSDLRIIHEQDSFVPSKHGRGGQSQGRIERGIEILAEEFFSKMAELANKIYVDENPVKFLIVGGPAMSKDQFLENKNLDYRLKEKIFKVYDVGYTGQQGIREILEKAKDDLEEIGLVKERNLVEKFKKELSIGSNKITYGEEAVRNALKMGAVDIILFSEGIDKVYIHLNCKNCEFKHLVSKASDDMLPVELNSENFECPNCHEKNTTFVEDEEELIDEIERLARDSGAKIEVISTKHESGAELLRSFTGIAALLRYPVNF